MRINKPFLKKPNSKQTKKRLLIAPSSKVPININYACYIEDNKGGKQKQKHFDIEPKHHTNKKQQTL